MSAAWVAPTPPSDLAEPIMRRIAHLLGACSTLVVVWLVEPPRALATERSGGSTPVGDCTLAPPPDARATMSGSALATTCGVDVPWVLGDEAPAGHELATLAPGAHLAYAGHATSLPAVLRRAPTPEERFERITIGLYLPEIGYSATLTATLTY